ncbi:MAG: SLC13 family permease [Dehalococcoidales bacterium]|nr:SLC13 family permease [Dehalococcoidales bacterium]
MFDLSQALAIIIFLAMFLVIIAGKTHRYVPALIGAGFTVGLVYLFAMRSPHAALGVFNLGELGRSSFWLPGREPFHSHGLNWQPIIFIAGMMVMVEGMAETGFFKWLCLSVAKLVNYRILPLFVGFILLSGLMSMFIDSITVLLFMATVTIELARLLKFDPVPLIIAIIFAANTGGAASMSGDPPNIIIGTAFGYSFLDFLLNIGLIAWISLAVPLLIFFIVIRKKFKGSGNVVQNLELGQLHPGKAITNKYLFAANVAVFFVLIVLLVTHAQSGLSVATIGVIAGTLTLVVARKKSLGIIKKIDWRSLVFFAGLFIVVNGLEETGVLKTLAGYIGTVSKGNITVAITIILWLSAFSSAIVDNIPFAATMVPVISGLSQAGGFPLPPLAWALSLGTDIGGNGTPIGASANVVGTAIAEREGHRIGWGRFLKYGMPGMILAISISWILLMVKYA